MSTQNKELRGGVDGDSPQKALVGHEAGSVEKKEALCSALPQYLI